MERCGPDPLRIFRTLPRQLFLTINSLAAWDGCWLPARWVTTEELQARLPVCGSLPASREPAQKPYLSGANPNLEPKAWNLGPFGLTKPSNSRWATDSYCGQARNIFEPASFLRFHRCVPTRSWMPDLPRA